MRSFLHLYNTYDDIQCLVCANFLLLGGVQIELHLYRVSSFRKNDRNAHLNIFKEYVMCEVDVGKNITLWLKIDWKLDYLILLGNTDFAHAYNI